ncbi:DsrE family protein [Paracoccus sp. TK19116]|uniref:DsrE family protein n=1 Tax=Paracoccus albicereus TaxID=2922394 RepID=A0ABT1MUK3_9RHOB|nr:DsrE family protein [Paracoccus albicereus]MCQ0971151.1 DsrE family protein [Paracoccus albicereus]
MTRLLSSIALAIATALALAAPLKAQDASEAAEAYAPQKVVYHLNEAGGDDGAGYKPALNNIQNHINAVGADNLDLRVVMHGDGVGLLQAAKDNQQLQGLISGLKTEGVRFLVCNNTLVGREIDAEADLFDVWPEDIVPSGVAELAKLQTEGFVYIKP